MAEAFNGGVRLYWRESGSGEPLLLIMGLGYSSDMWLHIEAGLSQHFRVIVFDNRGIGRSASVTGAQLIPTMAADAAAVLDAAGVQAAFVFGLSMGGYIAQELSLQYPGRVRALILGCTACGGDHVQAAQPEVLQVLIARAQMAPEQGVRAMIPYVYASATPSERIEADMRVRLANYPDPATYLGQIEGIRQWQSCSRLSQLDLPTLILHGEEDQLIPPANGKLLAEHIHGSVLQILPDASHVFTTDQPQLTVQAIREFLARH